MPGRRVDSVSGGSGLKRRGPGRRVNSVLENSGFNAEVPGRRVNFVFLKMGFYAAPRLNGFPQEKRFFGDRRPGVGLGGGLVRSYGWVVEVGWVP